MQHREEFALLPVPPDLHAVVARWMERSQEHPEIAGVLQRLTTPSRIALERVVAFSEFASSALMRDAQLLMHLAAHAEPSLALSADTTADAASCLRHWRRQRMTEVVWRDINGEVEIGDTLRSVSSLADQAIRYAVSAARAELRATFGEPRTSGGGVAELIVLGMGKLGGAELNFSSDIDLVLLYSEGGETTGPRILDNDEYFTRLARAVIRLLDANMEDGFVFRVDLRLRPFGESGPIAVSLAALEDYLQAHGRDWERYAWIKARAVVGTDDYRLAFRDCVRPFVYRRYLDFGVFESLRDMKALIAREVERRDVQDDLKLGAGGIREIEFIAQSFQLVRGGSDPRLQNAAILEVLPLLAGAKLLRPSAVDELLAAYRVLRKAENAVQMIRDAQTHVLPTDEEDTARVAMALGETSWEGARRRIDSARDAVSRHFAALLFSSREGGRATPQENMAWFTSSEAPIEGELVARNFAPAVVQASATALEAYRGGSAYRRLDEAGRRRVHRVLSALLDRTKANPNAPEVIARILRVIEAIGARSSYLALLNEQPDALERLIQVCEISGFLAHQIAEFPLLLDELIDARLFDELPSRADFAAQLELRMEKISADEPEREVEALRQFQKAATFAVALADLTGRLPLMKVSDRLTDIAELIVQRCVDLAWTQMTAAYGVPRCGPTADRMRDVSIAVVGYGKLGGIELGYGSDLDLVFLHDSRGEVQVTSSPRPQDNGVFFLRLGQRIVHLLTMHSTAGRLYEVDMRLRPNGKGGFLITGLDAFERYQREDAWTWEHQALLRARAVAGDRGLCRDFELIRRRVLAHSVDQETLRDEISHMRARMRRELSASGPDEFDVKQDAGGVADIEFMVQFWVLANAARTPELLEFSDNIRQLDALAAHEFVDAATAAELADCYRAFRAVLHHLTLENRDARVVPAHPYESARRRVREIWHAAFGEDA